jgi:putative FmdB family regulatory protein
MPIYGYRCSRGHHFEVMQRITEEALSACPECGAPVTRVFHPVGIIFKGQGFYKTDSRGTSGGDSGDGKAASSSAQPAAPARKESSDTGSSSASSPKPEKAGA